MNSDTLLSQLVSFPSVVGRPNGEIVGFIEAYLADNGVNANILPGPEGDRSNLFATIGPADRPGYVLSGHLDVVPASEPDWRGDPFVMRHEEGRLIGRGTCDMKGFVAAVLACVPRLVAMKLPVPIHIALSYDEEAGARGAPHMIARLGEFCALPAGCIVGEPTSMVPVLRHKGKAALRFTAKGVSGHSSRPDLGSNAIHKLAPVIAAAIRLSGEMEAGAVDPAFEPPYSTVQIGILSGGTAINILPDKAEMQVEARAIAGVAPLQILEPLREAAQSAGVNCEVLSSYPPLALPEDAPLAGLVARLTAPPVPAVSFGTEAGLFQQAGIATLICGPGDIARAHRPEEYITGAELEAAMNFVLKFASAIAD